jgi:hypothetical protein
MEVASYADATFGELKDLTHHLAWMVGTDLQHGMKGD